MEKDKSKTEMPLSRKIGILAAPVVFIVILLSPPIPGVSPAAQKVIAVAVWMLIWWITEAVQLPVTALLPIILFPLLGVLSVKEVTVPYGNQIIFLFLGGFMIALALEKWKLHLRIALNIIRLTGTNANGIILGFMLSTAFLSMWISNTSTTVLMFPIALSVINMLSKAGNASGKNFTNFSLCLMLSISYAASIGGIATLIGTPPNLIFAGLIYESYGYEITFFRWFLVGFPFTVVLLFFAYFFMTQVLYPNHLGHFAGSGELLHDELQKLGKMSKGERLTLFIFASTALLWIFKDLFNMFLTGFKLDDTIIAMSAGVALFITPIDWKNGIFVLKWEDTQKLPWGILLFFGGGLALGDALTEVGIIKLIGSAVANTNSLSILMIIFLLVSLSVFISELISNIALATVMVPVVAGIALGLGENPLLFSIPVAMAASCGFMLPMASASNAIVFASGYIKVSQMIKIGLVLNIISIILITFIAQTLMLYVFGIESGQIPDWVKP